MKYLMSLKKDATETSNKRSKADFTFAFFVTNISQGTTFLLQGLTYNIGNKKYLFGTVKSAMLLLFDISTYS